MPRTKKVTEDLIEQEKKITIKQLGQSAMLDDLKGKVTNSISIQDEHSLIENVVSNCFDKLEYNPRYRNISFATNILVYFCNIQYDTIEDICEFIYNENDLFDRVLKLINRNQLSNIKESIEKSIEFKKQVILAQMSKNNNEEEVFENINDCIVVVKNLLNSFSNSTNNIQSEELSSMLKDQVPKLIEVIGSMDKEKLTSTILDVIKEKDSKSKKTRNTKNNIIPLNGGDKIGEKKTK